MRLLIFTVLLAVIAVICAYEDIKLSSHPPKVDEPEAVTETIVVQEVEEEEVPLAGYYRNNHNNPYLLAKIAMAEAEGEDLYGKMLVIQVVLNRVDSKSFPNSILEVITEERNGTYQFSPVGSGRFDEVEPSDECWEALNKVLEGEGPDTDALYFTSEKGDDTWHHNNLEYLFTHGGHRFYK